MIQNIKKVSLILFIVLTGAHLYSTLALNAGYSTQWLSAIYNGFDIPAILIGLTYALSSFKDNLETHQKTSKSFDIAAGILLGITLITLLYLNFIA